MAGDHSEAHIKAVALALYQIRILLSGYLGTSSTADISVRQAAHLAYALHNEALTILEGGTFDAEGVARRVAALDGMLGSDLTRLFAPVLQPLER